MPLNAKVKTAGTTNGQGLAQASYECDSGYELFGPATVKCDPHKGWDRDMPFCGTNVAFRKPVNQSSATRSGPATLANDGKLGNENPDAQECSETQKEPSPWWRVDLLAPQTVRVVRITTRGCCGHQPIQDLEIRVGNSSLELQRNPLCAWYPGTVGMCTFIFPTKFSLWKNSINLNFQTKEQRKRLHVPGHWSDSMWPFNWSASREA